MAELWFYHLERARLDHVLPDLLEKTLARGWRALVQAGSGERAEAIDTVLWTYRDDSFLPHGTPTDLYPERQPVLVTTEGDNLNKADILFLVEGAYDTPLEPDRLSAFTRCIVIFDGADTEAVEAARGQWRVAKEAGIEVAYWQQNAAGGWEKKA